MAMQPKELTRTAPEHYEDGPPREDSELRFLPRSVRPIPRHRTSQVLMEVERSLHSFNFERSLSEACRADRFLQVRDRMYIVRLNGEIHGAVQGARLGLFDPDRLADIDVVYAIHQQGTARCRVYRIGEPAAR